MEIREPELKKVPVVDYDFSFDTSGRGLMITVWPTLGDLVEEDEKGYTFSFPRTKETQKVRHAQYLALKIAESERVDPVELIRRAKAAQQKAKTDGA